MCDRSKLRFTFGYLWFFFSGIVIIWPLPALQGEEADWTFITFVDYICPSTAYVYNKFIDPYKGANRHYI